MNQATNRNGSTESLMAEHEELRQLVRRMWLDMTEMCGDPHDPRSSVCRECACHDTNGCDYERQLEGLGIDVRRD